MASQDEECGLEDFKPPEQSVPRAPLYFYANCVYLVYAIGICIADFATLPSQSYAILYPVFNAVHVLNAVSCSCHILHYFCVVNVRLDVEATGKR